MRRAVLSVLLLVVIVVVPVGVYLLRSGTDGRVLRAMVGACSSAQRSRYVSACAYIDRHPAIEVAGPIDETGTPFAHTLYPADAARRIDVRLDSGRYAVFVEIDHHGTVRANVRADVDLSTGGADLGTLSPAVPWELTGVPGA
jgi:hypothetical protein